MFKEFESIEELVKYLDSDECNEGDVIKVETRLESGDVVPVTGMVRDFRKEEEVRHIALLPRYVLDDSTDKTVDEYQFIFGNGATSLLNEELNEESIKKTFSFQQCRPQLCVPNDEPDFFTDKPIDRKWYNRYDERGRKKIRKYQ